MARNRFRAKSPVDQAALRVGTVAMVEAYCLCGYTRSAAVITAAREIGVHPSTVWQWLNWSFGVGHQLGDRVLALAPQPLRTVICDSDWNRRRVEEIAKESKRLKIRWEIRSRIASLRARHPEDRPDAR